MFSNYGSMFDARLITSRAKQLQRTLVDVLQSVLF